MLGGSQSSPRRQPERHKSPCLPLSLSLSLPPLPPSLRHHWLHSPLALLPFLPAMLLGAKGRKGERRGEGRGRGKEKEEEEEEEKAREEKSKPLHAASASTPRPQRPRGGNVEDRSSLRGSPCDFLFSFWKKEREREEGGENSNRSRFVPFTVCICIYIYIYIYRGEKEKEKEKELNCTCNLYIYEHFQVSSFLYKLERASSLSLV